MLPLLLPLAEAAFVDRYSSADERLEQLLRVANILPCCPYRISDATRIRAPFDFLSAFRTYRRTPRSVSLQQQSFAVAQRGRHRQQVGFHVISG